MEKYYVTVHNGDTWWYKDAERTILHRIGGPAVEYADGGKAWYQDGLRHRIGGPAIERADGTMRWRVHGKRPKTIQWDALGRKL